MINETDLAQIVFEETTADLFLSSAGRLRHRFLAERAAKRIMAQVREEREMWDRRRARVVTVPMRREEVAAGD